MFWSKRNHVPFVEVYKLCNNNIFLESTHKITLHVFLIYDWSRGRGWDTLIKGVSFFVQRLSFSLSMNLVSSIHLLFVSGNIRRDPAAESEETPKTLWCMHELVMGSLQWFSNDPFVITLPQQSCTEMMMMLTMMMILLIFQRKSPKRIAILSLPFLYGIYWMLNVSGSGEKLFDVY